PREAKRRSASSGSSRLRASARFGHQATIAGRKATTTRIAVRPGRFVRNPKTMVDGSKAHTEAHSVRPVLHRMHGNMFALGQRGRLPSRSPKLRGVVVLGTVLFSLLTTVDARQASTAVAGPNAFEIGYRYLAAEVARHASPGFYPSVPEALPAALGL